MAIDFSSPSFRAAASDLTIAISPLGLVELADEEFEVHGPRLNRYANHWAFYLGHHWGYRREVGEPQITFNYTKALADYINNFTFGRGVGFRSPPSTSAIVPNLLRRVWEQDNHKQALLWEMGNQGGVSGDCFVKVAYEEPWQDPAFNWHPGRVRILPMNSAYCMPVEETEILTKRGWLSADEVSVGDRALSLDPETDELIWASVEAVNVFDWDGPMHEWKSKYFSALTTPDHRWITHTGKGGYSTGTRNLCLRTSADLHDLRNQSLVLAGGELAHFPNASPYSDEFVELVGWTVTEGWFEDGCAAFNIGQSRKANGAFCERLEKLAQSFEDEDYRVTRTVDRADGCDRWYFPVALGKLVKAVLGPTKALQPEFLTALTRHQAELLLDVLLDGDGDTQRLNNRERLYSTDPAVMASVQMLAMLLGKRSITKLQKVSRNKFGEYDGTIGIHQSRSANLKWMDRNIRHYKGRVWCPTTSTGTWVVRRKEVMPRSDTSNRGDQGSIFKHTVYLTGNCFPEKHCMAPARQEPASQVQIEVPL